MDTVRERDPDAELVRQAREELPYVTSAYETLVRKHERMVFAVCLRLLGQKQDAEEAFQDVLFKVFNYLPRFEERASFKTWMMKIAVNCCNTTRSKRNKHRDITEQLLATDPQSSTPDVGTAGFDVDKLLTTLNQEDRDLVVLRYVAEFGFEEIAEIAGLGLSATKMRIYRAVENLREKNQSAM